ncbi:Vacuolar protein sorting-associated protein 54 [Bienertia sinuspersici]
MAMNSKIIHHCRSKSSPIKPHSFVSQFNEQLNRLQSSEGAIHYKLNGLIDLLTFDDNLSQLTCTLHQGVQKDEKYSKLVESLLDESLWLIDVCGIIGDILMHTIEETHQLQSVLRRKADVNEVAKEVGSYFKSRKRFKKVIVRLLKQANSFRNKVSLNSSNENQKTASYLCVLGRSHSMAVDVLKSVFTYIACSRTRNKWSLISKLVHSKQEQFEEGCLQRTKFEVVDDALYMITCQKKVTCYNNLQIQHLRRHLEELELVAVDLERSIECLSRVLIKSRVVLLNILNQ